MIKASVFTVQGETIRTPDVHFLVKREVVDDEKPEVEHVEGPPRKRGNSDTAQGERETKRQFTLLQEG